MELEISEIMFRILLSFILSTIFGLERQFKKKPVGFGTFTFVATGSCILTIIGLMLAENTNPILIIGPIITGIGFLGAGALIRQERKVYGSTTAASIWGFAALGIAIGAGFIYLGLIFYGFIIIIVLLDTYFEYHSFGPYSKFLTITLTDVNTFNEIKKVLPKNTKVQNFSIDISKSEYTFSFVINARNDELSKIPNKLLSMEKIKSFKME
ncbi:MAG: MgtC/SapB family protein [Candidatus Aenigmatarchaeota archaeon]